jgi:hypothetical protein
MFSSILESANVSFFYGWKGGVEPGPLLLRPLIDLLYQPRLMMDDDECGAVGRMSSSGNRSIRRKPGPVPLCLPQIPRWEVGD